MREKLHSGEFRKKDGVISIANNGGGIIRMQLS